METALFVRHSTPLIKGSSWCSWLTSHHTAFAIALVVVLQLSAVAIADDLPPLYATIVDSNNTWVNEPAAEGDPGDLDCSSGSGQFAYVDSGGDKLVASQFQSFALPNGQQIDGVRVEVLCRYDPGTVANITAEVNLGNGWISLPTPQAWTSDATLCSWRLTTAGDITGLANWNATPSLVNQIQVRVGRMSGIAGVRLRVKAFRIIVSTTIIDRDGDGVPNLQDCAPDDPTRWQAMAYPDSDGDGVRDSLQLQSVPCFGITPPAGFTLNANGPDNCIGTFNPDQADFDLDGIGNLCDLIVGGAVSTRYARTIAANNTWSDEPLAAGDPISDNCNDSSYAYTDSESDWLTATSFQPFVLPAGQRIIGVKIGVLCRYDSGTVANIVGSVNIGGGWQQLPDANSWTSDPTMCDWRLTGVGDISTWADWRNNPNLVNQIQVRVRKQSGLSGVRLRVKAFKIDITTELTSCGSQTTPPANDECANSQSIIASLTIPLSPLWCATNSVAPAFDTTCATAFQRDVWYRIVPSRSMSGVTIRSSIGGDSTPQLALYEADSCGQAPRLSACGRTTYGTVNSATLLVRLEAQHIYYVRVGVILGPLTTIYNYDSIGYITDGGLTGDWTSDGQTSVQDLFAYLADYFAGTRTGDVPFSYPTADLDGDGGLQVGDLFAFLETWFAHLFP